MFRSAKLALVTVAATLLSGVAGAASITTYNPATAFSTASNPNGVWSYGYLNVTGTTFTPYASSTNAWHGNPNLEGWSQFSYDSNSYSVVGYNPTGSTQMENPSGSISIDPGLLFFHPGNSGEKADLRFTAPVSGDVDLSALFKAADIDGGNRDVHVYINGVDQLAPNTLNPAPDQTLIVGPKGTATPVSLSLTDISVSPGTTIDFAVGYGSDDVYYNDATTLVASITLTTPEPSSIVALVGLGGMGLVVAIRRRRSKG